LVERKTEREEEREEQKRKRAKIFLGAAKKRNIHEQEINFENEKLKYFIKFFNLLYLFIFCNFFLFGKTTN
jgi:hypothetical protein